MPTGQETSDFEKFKAGTLYWSDRAMHFALFEVIGYDIVRGVVDASDIRNERDSAIARTWLLRIERAERDAELAQQRADTAAAIKAAKDSARWAMYSAFAAAGAALAVALRDLFTWLAERI